MTRSAFSRSVIFALLIALACSPDNSVKPVVAAIPPGVKEYVDGFIAEGKIRGWAVDLNVSKLVIKFVDQITIGDAKYCGQGSFTTPYVELTQSCWDKASDIDKEILLFHELGHSLLHRQHLDDIVESVFWKSMMHSGNQFGMYTKFSPALRTYYLDELFNPATPPLPAFSSHGNSKTIFQDSIPSSAFGWTFAGSSSAVTHIGTTSSTAFASPGHSLSIQSSTTGTSDQFSYWSTRIPRSGIVAGSRVTLKVKVKTSNVTGPGTYIVLRADAGNEVADFKTTQNVIPITGTSDFSEYTVGMLYFPDSPDVNFITIYLLFSGASQGQVYFDDISVVDDF